MKVEDCIVTVERRTGGGCIDLAFVFLRQFLVPIYTLTAAFALPSLFFVWWLGDSMRHDVFLPSIVIFAFGGMLFSGALVATVGPQVFGVPITTRAALKGLLSRCIPYIFLGTIARMTGFCLLLPLLFVTAWCGHLPEVMLLEKTPLNQVTQRLSWLGKGGGYSRNIGRIMGICLLWAAMSVGVFLCADLLSGVLFNFPIFMGTIALGPDATSALASRLIDDPIVMVSIHACFWLTYPIARLAWFFCYLDQRIRNECWDLELQFRVEAGRLEEQMA